MLNPPLNQLTSQIKSKYLIATTAAKRAREIDEQPETELLTVKFALLFQVIIMVKNSFDH